MKAACVLSLIILAACTHDVELKLDTPEATVATLIKLYAAGDKKSRAAQLLDPVFTETIARREACADVGFLTSKCSLAATQAMLRGNFAFFTPSAECAHTPDYRDCTCGKTGSSAASNTAASFAGSAIDKGLALAHLSPDSCKITDRVELDKEKFEDLVGDFPACTFEAKEAAEAKKTAVTFTCGADLMTAIVRENTRGWQVVAFSDKTARSLSVNVLGEALEKSAKKREGELNKDLQ